MKIKIAPRFNIRTTKPIYKNGHMVYGEGVVIFGCQMKKALDGVWKNLSNYGDVNIPFDCFELIERY